MSFVLNEDEKMLQETARGFLQEHASTKALRALRDENNQIGYCKELWARMAKMGWCGIIIGTDYGGVDMGYSAAGLIMEEIGRNLTASPFLSTAILGTTALNISGTNSQKLEYLPKIAAGKICLAIAIDECARHDPRHVKTKANINGNGFILNGQKRFVICGMGADTIIVSARTEDDKINLFIVDSNTDGVNRQPCRTVDSHVSANIEFNNVQLPGDALLSSTRDCDMAYQNLLNAGRASLAAECYGVAAQAFEITIDYIKNREQLGNSIAVNQGLQHRAAHLYGELEMTEALVRRSLNTLDTQPSQAPIWCVSAKAKATEVVKLSSSEGIQMHGGVGMTDEYDIGLFYKRARAIGEFLGDESFGADEVARLSGY